MLNLLKIWIRYFLPFWDDIPKIGNPNTADVVLIQSFGRNIWTDAGLSDVFYRLRLACEGCDNDVRRFQFLKNNAFDAGNPNRELATACYFLMKKFGIKTVIAQWEVAFCLWYSFPADWRDTVKVVVLWPKIDCELYEYYSTKMVKEDSARKMMELGLKNPIELAHNCKLARSYLILRKEMKKLRMKPSIIVLSQNFRSFDTNSVLNWTRNRKAWLMREIPIRIHHLLFRWV